MKKINKEISGFNCDFSINSSPDGSCFWGSANINNPCVLGNFNCRVEQNCRTEEDVLNYLEEKVQVFARNPDIIHFGKLGELCKKCHEIIKAGDIFTE
ncbi:hypothetical protein [Legionella spiritensis]|uniref:hypothetical protein n=1 Tax=Legionella spiritensis TaxID=452 RepID=UPI000F6CEA45|nr:hypothetical protein [Legionella spiritensis]VEG89822.1 Uncharacterised protein [Legionella spiritensis]